MSSSYEYRSPFNYLNPYRKEDKNFFFGRSKEIDEVFGLFRKTNLVILYGPSGSGKSSMAQCGLANKFYDWRSMTIRRNGDFVNSFFKYLSQLVKLKSPLKDHFEGIFTLTENIEQLKNDKRLLLQEARKAASNEEVALVRTQLNSLKEQLVIALSEKATVEDQLEEDVSKFNQRISYMPFFIFDQFEELFIEGKVKEIKRFSLLLSLVTSKLSFSNAVICIQTEFFADLLTLEDYNPNILDYKCHIDDPTDANIFEIINGTFKYFNINQHSVPTPPAVQHEGAPLSAEEQQSRIQLIINKLKKDGKVHLPFLQIYLDKLYVEDFIRTYPKEQSTLLGTTHLDFTEKPLEFTEAEIRSYGDIEKILTAYITDINDTVLRRSHKIHKIGYQDTVLKFLKKFVSERDTRKTVEIEAKQRKSKNGPFDATYLDIVDKKLKESINRDIWKRDDTDTDESLGDIIEELLNARILKRRENYLELSHNMLAKVVKKIPIDNDILDYYKNHFDSAFNTYKQEKSKRGRKSALLSAAFVRKIGKDISYLLPKKKKEEKEKRDFWNKSEFEVKKKRLGFISLLIALLIFTAMALVYFGKFIESDEALKETITVLEAEKLHLQHEKAKMEIVNKVGEAINHSKTDLTKAFRQLDSIKLSAGSNDVDIEVFNKIYNDLVTNFAERPFYLRKITLDPEVQDRQITSTKSKWIKSNPDELFLFANTKSNLFSKKISLTEKSQGPIKWNAINVSGMTPKALNISAYKPYIDKNTIKVLYADNNGIFGTDYALKAFVDYKTGNLKNLSEIEYLGTATNGRASFVGLSATRNRLFRIVLKDLRISQYFAINDPRRSKPYFLENPEDALSNKPVSPADSYIKFLKKASNDEFCFIANVNDSVPFLFKQNIRENNPNDALDLRKIKENINIRDLKAFTVDMDQRIVLIADERMIYTINLDDFSSEENPPLLKINSHHQSSINSIDNYENQTFMGSDDKTASIYYDEKLNTKGDEVLSKVLIGHTDAIHNVSFVKTKKLYGLTSGEDGTIDLWDLSPLKLKSLKIRNAIEPIKIVYDKNTDHLYAGFAIDKPVENGYMLSINESLSDSSRIVLRKKPSETYLTTFDFDTDKELMVGTSGQGFIAKIKGNMESFRPSANSSEAIRINDLKIKGNSLAVATSKGLFFYENYKVNPVPSPKLAFGIDSIIFNSVDIHPIHDLILAAADNGKIYLWDPGANTLEWYDDHYDRVKDACFSKDGNFFVSASYDNTAIVWYLKNTSENSLIVGDKNGNLYNHFKRLNDHDSDVEDIEISENNILATGSSDKTVLLYEIEVLKDSPKRLRIQKIPSIIRHDYGVRSISFGENSTIIYSADRKGYIKKWDSSKFMDQIIERTSDGQ